MAEWLVFWCYIGPQSGCGGVLNATSGQLQSVDADANGQYENNLDCRWTIIGASNKVIRFSVQGLDIEPNANCIYDYLRVSLQNVAW